MASIRISWPGGELTANLVGHMDGDCELLRSVNAGDPIRVEHA